MTAPSFAPDPALSAELERDLCSHRSLLIRELGLPDEFVLPHYDLSIANVPATVAALLGSSLPGALPPLPNALWEDPAGIIQRVVCVILDAVGWLRFRRYILDEPNQSFARLARAGRFFPITSVFPGTTTSALTSLWTGYAPAQHGVVGHNLYLREFGLVVDTLGFCPAGEPRRGQMIERGLIPEEFPCVPGLAETLRDQCITTRTLIHHSLMCSGLSRLCFRGVAEVAGYITAADMWVCAREMLRHHLDEKLLMVLYHSDVDAISHYRGPDSPSWRAELRSLAASLQDEFLGRLTSEERSATLLLITADHGQTAGRADSSVLLSDHPELLDCLLLPPTGGPRAPYLYARQGRLETARGYLRHHLADRFAIVDSAAALAAGLLGPGRPARETPCRLGDLTVLARGHYLLDHRQREEPLLGLHGGLSAWEMLAPCLLARLDAAAV